MTIELLIARPEISATQRGWTRPKEWSKSTLLDFFFFLGEKKGKEQTKKNEKKKKNLYCDLSSLYMQVRSQGA